MRIKELSDKYKIDTRTIDYYSKEGLLPYQAESDANTYRNYTEESEKILKRILILRELGYSISEIKNMLHNHMDFSAHRVKYYAEELKIKREEEIKRLNRLICYTNDVQYSINETGS